MKVLKNFLTVLRNPHWIWITLLLGIIAFVLLYISEGQFPNLPLSSGIVAFISAVIGVLMTAFAISVQLKQQSEGETQKNKDVKIFEQKIDVYSDFTSVMWEMIPQESTNDDVEMLEKIRTNLAQLRTLCFKKLVFYLDGVQIRNIAAEIKKMSDNAKSIDSYDNEITLNAIALINNYLQDGLKEKSKEEIAKEIKKKLKGKDKKDIEIEIERQTNKEVKNAELKNLYRNFEVEILEKTDSVRQEVTVSNESQTPSIYVDQQSSLGNITFWYFILTDDRQLEAFKNNNYPWALNLIEYRNEDWRTNCVRQVQESDVVFLYKRGGWGYIGAFRVTKERMKILEINEYKKRKYSEEDLKKFDMYNSLKGELYGEESTLSSNILVEPIAYNFRGIRYQTVPLKTISRINNPDRVKFLLNRFNGNDMDWDKKRLDGKGKLDDDTPIVFKEENENYFKELLKKYNL